MLLQKKYCVSMGVLNLFQDLFISCLKVLLVGVGTKNKPLVRTENSSSVNMWCDRRGRVSCFCCTERCMC